MRQSLLLVRWSLVAVALVIAFFTFIVNFGLGEFPCDAYCAVIRNWSWSPFVSVLAIGGVLAIAVSLSKQDEKLFRALAWIGVGVSLCFQILAIVWEGVCPLCMGLAFVMLGIALTTIRLKVWGYVGILPALFGAFVIYDSNAEDALLYDPIEFTYRPYEKPPTDFRQLTYVIYADPECPACRKLAREELKVKRTDIDFLYRWYLLAPTSGRTLRAAIGIETVSRRDLVKGVEMRRAIFAENEMLTDEVILRIADGLGVRDDVAAALASPPADVLAWISADGKAFEKARHHAVPMPARLQPATMTLMASGPEAIYNMNLTVPIDPEDPNPPGGDKQQ